MLHDVQLLLLETPATRADRPIPTAPEGNDQSRGLMTRGFKFLALNVI